MLEQNDLKQIEKIVDKTTNKIVNKVVEREVDNLAQITANGFTKVHQEIGGLKKDVNYLQEDVERIERKLDAEMRWRDDFASPKMKEHERRIIRLEAALKLK